MNTAVIAQRVEQVFAGVNCGIMDQFASVFGRKDHALLLDYGSMEHEYIPLNLRNHQFLLLNTNVKHNFRNLHIIAKGPSASLVLLG